MLTEPADTVTPAEDWSIKIDDLKLGNLIGEGSFGKVYKARYMEIDVAAKEMQANFGLTKEFEHEVAVLKSLRHPLIVLWMGVAKNEDKVMLVQEYVSGGSLHKILQNRSAPLLWTTRSKMALEIGQALLFLHHRNMLHRDLKAENVLIESANAGGASSGFGKCKIADFGLSTLFTGSGEMNEVGTPWWRAPELSTHKYGPAADVFSFGVVLFELLTRECGDDIRAGMTTVTKRLEFATNAEQLKTCEQFSKEICYCPPEFWELASECCRDDPAQRPLTEQVATRLGQIHSKLIQLAEFVLARIKLLDSSIASIDHYTDAVQDSGKLTLNSFGIWMAAASSQLRTTDEDVSTITAPCSIVVSLFAERIQTFTGVKLEENSKEFLCSILQLNPSDHMNIEQYCTLWKWYNITEHMILHPLILPHFQDGFILGFVATDHAASYVHGKEQTFIVRFSGTKPGNLVFTCFHKGRISHVLVGVDYLESPGNGCFLLDTIRLDTLEQVLTKNNLQLLKYVFPDIDIKSDKFAAAFLKTKEIVRTAGPPEADSSRRYDVDIDRSNPMMRQLSSSVS